MADNNKGITLSALFRQSGYAPSTLSNALVRPWTKGEMIIANALGVEAKRIWPSRYRKKIRVMRSKECE
ncbi:helix-turn-helix domain-containing protein [Gilliamella sp. B2776]|uniref:helix-turn-helix domain-containing protein n=1 Tax=unclassified Gilliamella TaxID=2685620 RepID=UPI0027A2F983|nr:MULTISPECIES: helix-turn-helix domain-containing protein [unclassified Gilliamella]WDM19883.1 helix-turn-helix domain-containing protein [Gilliamella sp. B3022]MCX8650300.1 helix-turn-helix domain-containing protein [Gilliamella sp. B2779]MCX8654161.1 helix-turn-helix domain-containing protein [Gilliamella sp. B2737]MCX8692073.1 helix-turn-helix domain-containing protein [Gilliamella sp. B2776]MCX8703231.1 helix-turn-helix domain-containing protein [Gilliamella sp. B2781]